MYPSVSGVCELCGEECEDLLHIVLPRCPFLKARAENLLEYARATLLQSKTAADRARKNILWLVTKLFGDEIGCEIFWPE